MQDPAAIADSTEGFGLDGAFRVVLTQQRRREHQRLVRPVQVHASWVEAVDSVVAASGEQAGVVTVVCGAKGVGKSTLARYLTNRLLSRHGRLAFLDCDVGQPELTPPGLVSLTVLDTPLLGPPHTHLSHTAVMRYFIGDAQSKGDPPYYAACVAALLAAWRGDAALSAMPLVVNMDGWVKGFGESLLNGSLQAIQPHFILRLQGQHK